MSEPHIQLETLDPLRVAAVRVISATPERDARLRLQSWAYLPVEPRPASLVASSPKAIEAR